MQALRTMDVRKWLYAHKDIICEVLLALPVLVLGLWRLSEIQQPIVYSDEYGYWSNSAFFMGEDWSSVTSSIGYYSYGYSLILILVRLIWKGLGMPWQELYQLAVTFNAAMLVISYFLANTIARRYLKGLHPVIANVLCTVAFLYSSNIFYVHLTLTETTILFSFWVILYLLMRAADSPGIANHALLGVVSVYIYTVHQRTVAVLIMAVMMAVLLNLLKISRFRDTLSFCVSMFAALQLHSMAKLKLQNDSYLALEPIPWGEAFTRSLTAKTLMLLCAVAVLLMILLLYGRGKARLAMTAALAVSAAAAVYVAKSGILDGITVSTQDARIAVNDFSGQWGKIAGLMSIEGLLRLSISIIGKWFYMASVTGLVVCWGLKDLFMHGARMVAELVYAAYCVLRQKENKHRFAQDIQYRKEEAWFFGLLLAFLGTFLICAIYKEGFFKNDDLVNGRYNEFLMSMLLIYSFYALLQDKHWIRSAVVFLAMYLPAGIFCQYMFNELQRTEFELCHSVMLGRVIWNYAVPYGVIRRLFGYVLPLGAGFLLVLRAGAKFRNPKYRFAALIASLMIPAVAWTHLTTAILEQYNISVNHKYYSSVSDAAYRIRQFDAAAEHTVYFFTDTKYERFAQQLQYILQDRPVIETTSYENTMEEDAYYVVGPEFAQNGQVLENCFVIAEAKSVQVLVNKDKELAHKWYRYIGRE